MMLAFHSWFFLLVLASCTAGSLLDEVLTAFEHAVDCGSCHALLVPLKALALLGDSTFVDTLVTVCQTLKVGTAASCPPLPN